MFNFKDIETMKGYKELSVSTKIVFNTFLVNFMNSQGTEVRETIIPISVKYVDGYLRFDYKRYGNKEWLHVKGSNTWY